MDDSDAKIAPIQSKTCELAMDEEDAGGQKVVKLLG